MHSIAAFLYDGEGLKKGAIGEYMGEVRQLRHIYHFSRISQLQTTQHTPCAVLYVLLVPVLIGCLLVPCNPMCDQFQIHVFRVIRSTSRC